MRATKSDIWHIYTLSCPLTGHVRYVGRTTRPRYRKNSHNSILSGSLISKKRAWVKSLKDQGLSPVFEILETIAGNAIAEPAEYYWLWQFKTWGFELLNERIGDKGKGILPEWFSTLVRNRRTGRIASDETKLRMSLVRKGKRKSIASREKHKATLASKFRKVFQVRDGTVLSEYSNISDAAESVGVTRNAIKQALMGKGKTCKGFHWQIKYEENDNKYINTRKD